MNSIIHRSALQILPLCFALIPGLGKAAVIDFTDGIFSTIVDSGINNEPVIFEELADGVTFTLESTLNLVGTERFLGIRPSVPSNGLHLGGGGGSTIEFTLLVDHDVTLDSYSTDTGGAFLGMATFDVVGGTISSLGNSLAQGLASETFATGPLALTANTLYTFNIQNTGAGVQSFVDSISFTANASVPLPGSLSMFALGLLGLRRVAAKTSVTSRRRMGIA